MLKQRSILTNYKKKVIVEIGTFDNDDDAKAACDFIINLLDINKTEVPFEATVH